MKSLSRKYTEVSAVVDAYALSRAFKSDLRMEDSEKLDSYRVAIHYHSAPTQTLQRLTKGESGNKRRLGRSGLHQC